MNDEACSGVTLGIKGQEAARGGFGVEAIDPCEKRLAAQIRPAQVISGWGNQPGKVGVSGGEVGMSLYRVTVILVERAIYDDTWRKSRDVGTRSDSDVAGNLAGAGVGYGGGAEDAVGFG